MKNSFLIVTATLLVSVFFSCTKERVTAGSVNEVYEFQSVDSTWKLLTLREKIGQTMLMLPDRKKELDLGDGSLEQCTSNVTRLQVILWGGSCLQEFRRKSGLILCVVLSRNIKKHQSFLYCFNRIMNRE